MKRATAGSVVLAFWLLGCSAKSPEQEAIIQHHAARQVIAVDKAGCDLMWGRAVAWVARFSSWKIQTQTDYVIQTFGPGETEVQSAFVVSKLPLNGGGCELQFRAACGNIFGCDEPGYVWKAHFTRYVYGEIS